MKNFVIYTDGSHLKHTSGRLGIGGILVYNGSIVDSFSLEVEVDFLRKNYGTSDVSNPTCEMLAVLLALRKFKDSIGGKDNVCVKADYTGVKNFIEGLWKIKAPYIQKIKNDIDSEISAQKLKGRISFEWIKGHQAKSVLDPDAVWNNYVDSLAKGERNE